MNMTTRKVMNNHVRLLISVANPWETALRKVTESGFSMYYSDCKIIIFDSIHLEIASPHL